MGSSPVTPSEQTGARRLGDAQTENNLIMCNGLVAELADAVASKAIARYGRVGSSPTKATVKTLCLNSWVDYMLTFV